MLDNYRDLIDELLGTPAALRSLGGDAGPEGLPAPVISLIGELRDRDLEVHARLQTMRNERNPYLRALAESPRPMAGSEDAEAALQGFDAARGELVSLLMNLTLKDWERTATHEVDGEITLADEVERHVEFDEDRLAQARAAAN